MFRHTFWGVYGQFEEHEKRRLRAHLTSVRSRVKLQQRVALLEEDLARMGLLTIALAKLCVDKGVMSADELRMRMKEIDLSDGVEDGKEPPEAADLGGGETA